MKYPLKPLSRQVLVITGASSGIGLATARAAAARGARLVLASRNAEALADVERDLQSSGTEVVHAVADVGQRADLQRVADLARERFGGFDTWVNNAGHSIYGRLAEVSDEDHRRLFETNFWGLVYGSLIAVEHLRSRGGALINLGSVASDQALPLQGMYCASKHAVKGFTDALRMELEMEEAPVSVTLIKPTGIDTPFPQHARNYLEQEPKLPPPVYAPEEVAHAILYAAEHPKRDIYIGSGARVGSLVGKLAPHLMDRTGRMMAEQQRRGEPPRDPSGSLHQPGVDGRVHGDHPGYVMRRSFYTRSSLHPVMTGAIVAAAGVAAATWMSRTRRSEAPGLHR